MLESSHHRYQAKDGVVVKGILIRRASVWMHADGSGKKTVQDAGPAGLSVVHDNFVSQGVVRSGL